MNVADIDLETPQKSVAGTSDFFARFQDVLGLFHNEKSMGCTRYKNDDIEFNVRIQYLKR